MDLNTMPPVDGTFPNSRPAEKQQFNVFISINSITFRLIATAQMKSGLFYLKCTKIGAKSLFKLLCATGNVEGFSLS